MSTLMTKDVELSDEEFRKISDLVYDHCGINLHEGKKELVRARLAKRLRLSQFTCFADYLNHVLSDKTGVEFSVLVDSLSTNLTSFFREIDHFNFVRNTLLPRIMEQGEKTRNKKIRAWSAGCSSGEEPYSISMTVLDAIQHSPEWDFKLLATDISTTNLQIAKRGYYDQQRVAPVSAAQKQRYLKPVKFEQENYFEVQPILRKAIYFNYLNLMKEWPIKGPLNFIFCRNVMIYFDKKTQAFLVNRYWDLLERGGVLFTGHSESLTGIDHKFKYVQPTIYMKP
jgi:chemotaxis protein methyltransferase CheR